MTGAYGVEEVPTSTPDAITCGVCGRSWAEDIAPAGRCPWETDHVQPSLTAEERVDLARDAVTFREVMWVFGDTVNGQEPGSFYAKLIDAAIHADAENRDRLARGFPAVIIGVTVAKNAGLRTLLEITVAAEAMLS